MELWDVYDGNGNKTGRVKKRGDHIFEGEYQLAAALWIINSAGEVLIQKRAPEKRRNPGKWSITGGVVLSGETSTEGCLREVREEIGVTFREEDIQLFARTFSGHMIFDDYVAAADFDAGGAVLQSEEVSEIRWVHPGEILRMHSEGLFVFEARDELVRLKAYIESGGHQDRAV